MQTAYHMVHYRRFDAGSADVKGQTLESLCRKSLASAGADGTPLWERVQDRLFTLTDGTKRQLLLNKVADLSSAVFGEICLVHSNDLQAFLERKASTIKLSDITTAQIFDLAERSAPKGAQFIRGLAYWLAIGDHLLFVSLHGLKADLIHAYINWLIKTCGPALASDIDFQLQAAFDPVQIGGDIGEIQSLKVSGKSAPQFSAAPQKAAQKSKPMARRIAAKFAEFAQAVDLAKAIFGEAKTKTLVSSLGPSEYLAVEAEVKVRGSRSPESQAVMRNLAAHLDETIEGTVRVEGKDGKMSDGDAILRTRMPFALPIENSNFLEFDNVADQLQEVFSRFVKDGKLKV